MFVGSNKIGRIFKNYIEKYVFYVDNFFPINNYKCYYAYKKKMLLIFRKDFRSIDKISVKRRLN